MYELVLLAVTLLGMTALATWTSCQLRNLRKLRGEDIARDRRRDQLLLALQRISFAVGLYEPAPFDWDAAEKDAAAQGYYSFAKEVRHHVDRNRPESFKPWLEAVAVANTTVLRHESVRSALESAESALANRFARYRAGIDAEFEARRERLARLEMEYKARSDGRLLAGFSEG